MFELGDQVRLYKEGELLPIGKGKVSLIQDEHVGIENEGVFNIKNVVKDITYLSPTSLSLFEKDKDEFYMKYLSRMKAPLFLQTQPMSLGSAFDAYVKSYIIEALSNAKGYKYSDDYKFEKLFEKQVESHNRAWAREHGKICFDRYKASGALASLMLELNAGDKAPRFEFRMLGKIGPNPEGKTVPIVGVPDLYFQNSMDAHVVIDWKVNGYCSKYPQSPKPFYTICRDSWVGNQSRNNNQSHKETMTALQKGILVDIAHHMETVDEQWAMQLTTYAWLLGEPVGGDFIVGIEQLSGASVRVASFRNRVSKAYQEKLLTRYQNAWDAVCDPQKYYGRAQCELLEKQAVTLHPTGDAKEDWFSSVTRSRQ